jgi:hypothetical protein
MGETTRYDEERLVGMLLLLPAAPDSWVRAAKELPLARAELRDVGAAVQHADFRASVEGSRVSDELADVEARVRAAPDGDPGEKNADSATSDRP